MKKEQIKVGEQYINLNNEYIYTIAEIRGNDIFYSRGVNDYVDICSIDWFCEKFEPYNGKVGVVESPNNKDALDRQIGGNHYKDMKIQPIEYISANELDFFQGNVIKYITRHKNKNGAEDIKKIKHYCDLILKYQYNEK